MSNYFETIYFRDEIGENDYPQKLCDYLIKKYSLVEGYSLLDIGCGKGNHLIGFARRGLDVKGIDKLSDEISLDTYDIRYCNFECDVFPFKDDSFDIVFSKSVIEHVANTNNFLSQSYRVLKEGGVAIIMTPDWHSQYKFFWDDYTHVKPWTRKSLQNAMKINGFNHVYCERFIQLPEVWKYPWLKYICSLVSLLPDSLKWKDSKEEVFRRFIRFSKEKMLLAVGVK